MSASSCSDRRIACDSPLAETATLKVPLPPPAFPQPRSDQVAFKPLQDLDKPEHRRLREHALQQTSKFRQGYEAQRSDRERILAPLLAAHHRDRVVLVMTLN